MSEKEVQNIQALRDAIITLAYIVKDIAEKQGSRHPDAVVENVKAILRDDDE